MSKAHIWDSKICSLTF